jgi:hypothetical protein
VVNDDDSVDIKALFADSIIDERTTKLTIDMQGEEIQLELWSLKCNKTVRFDGGGYNFAFLTGNSRSVIDYSIDDQLGLHLLMN